MELSVIVPVYNEETRLQKPLNILYKYLQKKFAHKKWELIIVNDGSIDNTKQLIKNHAKIKRHLRLLSYPKNKGKGYAIAKGIKEAKGKYIFFMDIDLSVKPRELRQAITLFKKQKAAVVIGSRRVAGSKITVHQPWLREMLGHCYTLITTVILGLPLSDLTCGFKGFKRAVARDIFKRLTATRWSFDAEILYKAHKKGYKILEMPITWEHVENSKVNLGVDAIKSFIEVVRIRLLTSEVKKIVVKG